VEAYGTYTISEKLKLSGGKYLTPLSPVNQYFYAPLNPSASLPMVVSHHFLLPQSVSGFQVSGEFGETFKLGYNFTYGHYQSVGHPAAGIIGIQGAEDRAVLQTDVSNVPMEYHLGGCFRVNFNYNDIVNLGLNYFDGRHSTQTVAEFKNFAFSTFSTKATRFSSGVDFQLKLNNFKLNSEYWYGEQKTTDLPVQIINEYSAFYSEMIFETGIFSPYARYDKISDLKATMFAPYPDVILFDANWHTDAYTIGVGIRPIYEVLLKLEYKYVDAEIDYSNENIPTYLQDQFPPENPLNVTEDKYNYYLLSLVLSF